MRFADLIVPFSSMTQEAQLNLIRQVRYRRHIEKPKKVMHEKKEARPRVKKAQLALDLLTPEQIEKLKQMYADE